MIKKIIYLYTHMAAPDRGRFTLKPPLEDAELASPEGVAREAGGTMSEESAVAPVEPMPATRRAEGMTHVTSEEEARDILLTNNAVLLLESGRVLITHDANDLILSGALDDAGERIRMVLDTMKSKDDLDIAIAAVKTEGYYPGIGALPILRRRTTYDDPLPIMKEY